VRFLNRPKCSPARLFVKTDTVLLLPWKKVALANFVILLKKRQSKHLPKMRKFAQSGRPDCNSNA
jgi:hypothetical protein